MPSLSRRGCGLVRLFVQLGGLCIAIFGLIMICIIVLLELDWLQKVIHPEYFWHHGKVLGGILE